MQFAAKGQNESEAGGFAIKSLLLHTVYWSVYILTQQCNTVSKCLQVFPCNKHNYYSQFTLTGHATDMQYLLVLLLGDVRDIERSLNE